MQQTDKQTTERTTNLSEAVNAHHTANQNTHVHKREGEQGEEREYARALWYRVVDKYPSGAIVIRGGCERSADSSSR